MTLTFYPHTDDAQKGSLSDRLEILMEAAERYKAIVLDNKTMVQSESEEKDGERAKKRMVPRDLIAAFNWEEITRVLRQIRELPEMNKVDKTKKADLLAKLSEIYEVLRGAKMSKLEAVRLALVSESNQLRGSASQVA